MSWPNNPRPAKSLTHLREQINAAYPGRDHESDGLIGDARHQAEKTSDHNPWVKDDHNIGVVTAMDIDKDLDSGADTMHHVVDSICASRDPRVKYIIFDGKITVKGSHLQAWQAYHGVNAHKHHAHFSVFPDQHLYDDVRDWVIGGGAVTAPIAPIALEPAAQVVISGEQHYIVEKGDTLWGISRKFATSVDTIKQFNGLTTDVIQIGQILRVK